MITIVATSFKGGTAKSSVSLHLASALSLFHGKRCLLIDFDPQANLSSGLGFSTDDLLTMVPVLQEEMHIQDVIKPTCIENLDIVTANTYLDQIEATAPLFNDPYAHERLRNALKDVSGRYDYAFIDIPPSLNWLTKTAFYAANYSLVCAIPEPFSILALNRLAKFHETINRNHSIDVLGVALSFWDVRGAINDALVQGIEFAFPGKILESKIRRDKSIPKAVIEGKPVFLTDKTCRASEDYKALADEVAKILERVEAHV